MNYSKNYEDFRRLHENVSKMTAHWNGRNGSSFEFCDVIVLSLTALRSRGRSSFEERIMESLRV